MTDPRVGQARLAHPQGQQSRLRTDVGTSLVHCGATGGVSVGDGASLQPHLTVPVSLTRRSTFGCRQSGWRLYRRVLTDKS